MNDENQAPLGDGVKRAVIASVGALVALCSIVAFNSGEIIVFCVLALAALVTFAIAVFGGSEAVRNNQSS